MLSRIELNNDSTALLLTAADGQQVSVTAVKLRSQAMDAASRRYRLRHGELPVDENIRITAIQPMGSTGINLSFSDGHCRAVYPFAYLRRIGFATDN